MPDRSGPVITSPQDIRGLSAKFDGTTHFATIRGDAGFITAAGAKVGIFSRWIIRPSGKTAEGKTRFRFRAQFRWTNEVFMNMVGAGRLRGRVILQMKTRKGQEDVDILGWAEWRYEGGVLTLEDIYQTEGTVKYRALDK